MSASLASSLSSKEIISRSFDIVRHRFVTASSLLLESGSSEERIVRQRTDLIFKHTVLGGKNARSTLAMTAFDALRESAREEERRKMAESAVAIEMSQSFYLILDDIMDEAETRRGRPCWHKMPDIGMAAINDGVLLDVFVDDVVDESLGGHPNTGAVREAFRRSKRKTVIGQLLDMSSVNNLDQFTWDRYEQLVEHKTSHYTYFLPLELATLVADIRVHLQHIRSIAYKIGFLFQSQDDVLDVFGDSKVMGKIGTDIQDGKCTWVTVRAMQLMQKDEKKRSLFQENFGSSDAEKVAVIRSILDDLKIEREFERFEEKFAESLMEDVQSLPLVQLQPVLLDAVTSMLRRKK